MDTEEMYRRGVADAEQGTPHPFYYEHYYHYRRGYNRTRRRLYWLGDGSGPRPLVFRLAIVAVVLLGLGVGAYSVLGRRAPQTIGAPVVTAQPTAVSNVAEVAVERTPIFPTATTVPSPTPVVLRVGGLARVSNTGGRPLRAREGPGLQAPARAAFSEGEEVRLLEGPEEADGYTWWRVEGASGTGWSAQRSPEGMEWLVPITEE